MIFWRGLLMKLDLDVFIRLCWEEKKRRDYLINNRMNEQQIKMMMTAQVLSGIIGSGRFEVSTVDKSYIDMAEKYVEEIMARNKQPEHECQLIENNDPLPDVGNGQIPATGYQTITRTAHYPYQTDPLQGVERITRNLTRISP